MKHVLVSFQGEHGAYSEAAASSFFEKKNTKIKTVPHSSFSEILAAAEKGKTDFAILPVENSLEGSVGESYDLLYSTTLKAAGEIYFKVQHCLIGTAKTVRKVKTAYSHPQALGQCRKFLQKNKISPMPAYDTAGSVSIIKELEQDKAAAIASRRAAEIYQMPVIKEGIADNPNNYTRFLLMSKKSAKKTGDDKTSIIFSIKHKPGTLVRILEEFYKNNVNLTKIESRPKKVTAWEYNFYVDFEGHKDNKEVSSMLKEIKKHTIFFKIVGSYPAGRLQ